MDSNNLTDRFLMIEKYFNVNPNRLQKITGKSARTYANIKSGKTTDPGVCTLGKLCEVFPELNPMWVFLGKGEMIKKDKPYPNDTNNVADIAEVYEQKFCSFCTKKEGEMTQLRNSNYDLLERIESQSEEIGRLKEQLENVKTKEE
jgi:transcriptional regulator with XRE-family HTH domain